MSFLLLLLLFAVAWVVLILPKQRELKRHNALIASLVVGDEVMTGTGIYGTITLIDGDLVKLEIAPGVEIRLARRAVASRIDDSAGIPDDEDVELEELEELEELDRTDFEDGGRESR